jgi:hypothetical protein
MVWSVFSTLFNALESPENKRMDIVEAMHKNNFYISKHLVKHMTVGDIIRCRLVSKTWNFIFSSDEIWRPMYYYICISDNCPDYSDPRNHKETYAKYRNCTVRNPQHCPRSHYYYGKRRGVPKSKIRTADFFNNFVCMKKSKEYAKKQVIKKMQPLLSQARRHNYGVFSALYRLKNDNLKSIDRTCNIYESLQAMNMASDLLDRSSEVNQYVDSYSLRLLNSLYP